MKARVGDLERLAPNESREVVRQLRRDGHRCAADQCRNHPDATAQRGRNLSSNVVVRIVQSAPTGRVRATEPGPSNDGDKGIARADRCLDTLDKILPGLIVSMSTNTLSAPKRCLRRSANRPA